MKKGSEYQLFVVRKRENEDAPWREILSRSAIETKDLSGLFDLRKDIQKVVDQYPIRINPYYMGLIRHQNDPIYNQCIPDIQEITLEHGMKDPLNEEELSPVPGLTHRYPDRVLFLVSSQCAMYCRFCNRKRKVGRPSMVTEHSIKEGLAYIRNHRKIRDVLLSGGDPFLLGDSALHHILTQLRAMPHVEIIRIGTRVPCTLPQRVTSRLANMLKAFHPLYIHTHFNHPDEITQEAALACKRLADVGIPMGCQTVLLKGVNDNLNVIRSLMQKLLMIRVRPYYLFQTDLAKGTAHFWTPLQKGLDVMSGLQGYTSGLCVPHFTIDLPGGGGKVNLVPDAITGRDGNSLLIRDYLGKEHRYPVIEE